jgi:23S rRNA A2030 N6-methylase RlmJ
MNPFFGRIGDVWKHLLLMEVVDSLRPIYYFESHAGSAFYPLTRSPDRDFGVYAFLDAAADSPPLANSRYHSLLRALPRDDAGEPSSCPGSSGLVMMVLGTSARYELWDIDEESVRDLREAARSLGVDRDVAILGDGLDGVEDETMSLSDDDRRRALVLIDPFDPFEASERRGMNSVDVAVSVAARGVPLFYWYGYDDERERGWAWSAFADHPGSVGDAWAGEIGPATADAPGLFQDGMRGCGVLCVNCPSAVPAMRAVAESFVEAYRERHPAHSDVPGLRYDEFA